jgi:hypothetical protein
VSLRSSRVEVQNRRPAKVWLSHTLTTRQNKLDTRPIIDNEYLIKMLICSTVDVRYAMRKW